MNAAASFPVPENGVDLQSRQKQQDLLATKSEKPPQVIFLDLGQPTIQDLIRSCKNNERVRLRFGRRQMLHYGEKSRQVYARPEVHPSELYVSGDGGLENLFFSGSFSHRVELEKPQENTSEGNQALVELTQSLNALKEEATSNEARLVTPLADLKTVTGASKTRPASHLSPLPSNSTPLRRDGLLGNVNRTTNSSPFLAATSSPGATPKLGPTSAPILKSTTSTKEQMRLDAIKFPLTHLLALGPQSLKLVSQRTGASPDDCQKLLARCAQEIDGGQGRFKLKDKAYKDLDIWRFPYPLDEDRQRAIDRAISAFDRMRLARSDQLWQQLLPDSERGKGKCLSRLNFDGRQQNGQSRPVGGHKSSSTLKTDRKTEGAGEESSKAASKVTAAARPAHKKAPTFKERFGSNRVNTISSKLHVIKKTNKVQNKYKSSEIIEDSDEDVDMSDGLSSEATRHEKQQTNGAERRATERKPPPSQQGQPSRAPQPANNDRSRFLSGVLNGRPRAASSPQKPSPLASSPPTNATDIDNSRKATPESSTASPPPSAASASRPPPHQSLAHVKTTSHNPSPSTESSKASSRPLKRVADASSISTTTVPPKRHKTNGVSTNTISSKQSPQTNGHQPPSTLSSSTSTSTTEPSSPTTPYTVESLFELSKRFTMAYKKYETLHAKIEKEQKPDARDMERLLRMHQRVAEMKEEMSRGWGELTVEDQRKSAK